MEFGGKRYQQQFGGGDELAKRRRATFRRSPPGRWLHRRNMNELNQRLTRMRILQRLPIGIVAEITPGIA
jgi:hypothetical protein